MKKIITQQGFALCFCVCILMLFNVSCKDFVNIEAPIGQIVDEKVYSNDESATAALRGIYSQMISTNGFASGGANSVTMLAGLSADDFKNYSSMESSIQFSTNNLTSDNLTTIGTALWQEPYKYIYFANLLIENLDKSPGVSAKAKLQLSGEAKFIRAFCHFYLTNLFGNVPYIQSTDYKSNTLHSANSSAEIYTLLIKDLTEAKTQLSSEYASAERGRPNRWAAAALLARVYLYHKDWLNAERESSEVIAQNSYSIVSDLNQVFVRGSTESIWQLAMPPSLGFNTKEASNFILISPPGSYTGITLSDELLSSFEPGDKRNQAWVGTFSDAMGTWKFPFKYKQLAEVGPSVEYSVVLRLAEQYLIRAEARVNQGKITDGLTDLNLIRSRARNMPTSDVPDPLPNLELSLSQSDALMAVERERRIELFSEWGHRWMDLKRTSRATLILGPLKAPNWQESDVLYPIPASELLNAPNLRQNPGYN